MTYPWYTGVLLWTVCIHESWMQIIPQFEDLQIIKLLMELKVVLQVRTVPILGWNRISALKHFGVSFGNYFMSWWSKCFLWVTSWGFGQTDQLVDFPASNSDAVILAECALALYPWDTLSLCLTRTASVEEYTTPKPSLFCNSAAFPSVYTTCTIGTLSQCSGFHYRVMFVWNIWEPKGQHWSLVVITHHSLVLDYGFNIWCVFFVQFWVIKIIFSQLSPFFEFVVIH